MMILILFLFIFSALYIYKFFQMPNKDFKNTKVRFVSIFGFDLIIFLILYVTYLSHSHFEGSFCSNWPVHNLNHYNPVPLQFIIVPLLLMTFIQMYLPAIIIKKSVIISIAITIIAGLSCNAITNGSDHYTCQPEWIKSSVAKRKKEMRYEAALLFQSAQQNMIETDAICYPAGWFSELPFVKKIKFSNINEIINRIEKTPDFILITEKWYTPLTGIYQINEIPAKIWYPGGKLKEGIGKLEYRPYNL